MCGVCTGEGWCVVCVLVRVGVWCVCVCVCVCANECVCGGEGMKSI